MLSFDEFYKSNVISEASLSRTWQAMQDHDTGFITAFRGKNTKAINQGLNRELKSTLEKKFGVTAVKGAYIEDYGTEDAVEVSEESLFVVDLKDTGDLKSEILKLGNKYDQDSVLYVPKGGTEGLLIGTNDSGYPGMNKVIKFANPVFGKTGMFNTKVNGRPFIFKEPIEAPVDEACNYLGRMAKDAIAKGRRVYDL